LSSNIPVRIGEALGASGSPRRCVVIHGHFYQPPRENPWRGVVERQGSAAPYHDWNERITAECYLPNSTSRILDRAGRIAELVNNYSLISFNFGPTLLNYLERAAPDVYAAILEGDRLSCERLNGHGNALAQAYNHIILPLAPKRDKRTQVRWGIADFRRRFGRDPEGLWLPETAVDTATLEVLAAEGIRFTILAPHQAGRVRSPAAPEWRDASERKIDTRQTYTVILPSGREMALVFYRGDLARAVAFEGLLKDGAAFANALLSGFDDRTDPQLVHFATDGESYGHHHKFGDMALAFALKYIERETDAAVVNYGWYLDRYPLQSEVEIVERTAWSCSHGISRWQEHCGCATGEHPGWHQQWRTPLRTALDGLRDRLANIYEEEAGALLTDPWAARDDYIALLKDGSRLSWASFLERWQRRSLTGHELDALEQLLEMQHQALLMFTSCGWFFDDIAGLETVQDLQYACRALELGQERLLRQGFGVEAVRLETDFLTTLSGAAGNRSNWQGGKVVFDRIVRPRALSKLLQELCDLDESGWEALYPADSSLPPDPMSHARIAYERLTVAMDKALNRLALLLGESVPTTEHLATTLRAVGHCRAIPLPVNLYRLETAVWQLGQRHLPEQRAYAGSGDPASREWCCLYEALAGSLQIVVVQ